MKGLFTKPVLLGVSSVLIGGGAFTGIGVFASRNTDNLQKYTDEFKNIFTQSSVSTFSEGGGVGVVFDFFKTFWSGLTNSTQSVGQYVISAVKETPGHLTSIASSLKEMYSQKDSIYQLVSNAEVLKQLPKLTSLLKDSNKSKKIYELFNESNKDNTLLFGQTICGTTNASNIKVESGTCTFLIEKLIENSERVSESIKNISQYLKSLQKLQAGSSTSSLSTLSTSIGVNNTLSINKNVLSSWLNLDPNSTAAFLYVDLLSIVAITSSQAEDKSKATSAIAASFAADMLGTIWDYFGTSSSKDQSSQ